MSHDFPFPKTAALTALLLVLGALGGAVVARSGMPMPFLLGSLAATAVIVGLWGDRIPAGYAYPVAFRKTFVGVIGVMIGAQVDRGMIGQVPGLALSLAGIVVFVVAAQAMNFAILRRLGGFDPATAWYGGAPGGLIESIALGEEAGGDVRVLTLLQFLRIILVVTIVPVAMSLWLGGAVGSAAGQSFTANGAGGTGAGLAQILLVFGLAIAGVRLGQVLRLPAGQLIGPLLLAALLGLSGLMQIGIPGWLLAVAQVVLGVGLGLRFVGVDRRLLARGLGVSLISVGAMLALGAGLALLLSGWSPLPVDVLIISFAPGGVTEMGLIALSLAANPAMVTLHHLFRIVLTVLLLGLLRRLGLVRL